MTIEYYLEHVDEWERQVVSTYAMYLKSNRTTALAADFKVLYEKVVEYRVAKRTGVGVQPAQLAFAEACKSYEETFAQSAAG